MPETAPQKGIWHLSYEPPDRETLETFLKTAHNSHDTTLFPVFLLLVETGMTVDEVLDLSFRDYPGSGQIVQNATSQIIQLQDSAQNALEQWLGKDRAEWIAAKKRQGVLLANTSQKIFPISKAYLQCALNELMRDAGIQPFVLSALEKCSRK